MYVWSRDLGNSNKERSGKDNGTNRNENVDMDVSRIRKEVKEVIRENI